MCGEIIPRRVLCPWRPHLLASTLPAVARATAACFVRGEWVVGRGLGLLRGPSSGWCVSGARRTAARPFLGVPATGTCSGSAKKSAQTLQ
eukprot:scaffold3057_cov60-Phaeocystis_antarctica.AAC.2